MGYYTEVYGTLKCKDLKEAEKRLNEIGLITGEHFDIIYDKEDCICPNCNNKHTKKLNNGEIHFNSDIKSFTPDILKPIKDLVDGELECRGEDFYDIYKIVFEDGKMDIIKPKW